MAVAQAMMKLRPILDSCGGGVMKIGRSRKAVIDSTQGRMIISLKSPDNQSKHH